jgi:hypothetical protein
MDKTVIICDLTGETLGNDVTVFNVVCLVIMRNKILKVSLVAK